MAEPAPSIAPVVRMEHITKRFGRATVLDGVSLELRAGEVHALLGENGAGKSTLLKILAGVYTDHGGTIFMGGEPVRPRSPAHALALGIAVIHQELSLLPALSIAENLFVERPLGRFGLIDRGKERARARAVLAEVGLDLDPDLLVERLSLPERQLVEIARALGRGARVLIMDEPTSALAGPAIEKLFELIRGLQARGVAVVYVSHRMEEIERIADRLTVLRDGRVVGAARVSEVPLVQVITWMLGPRGAASGAAPAPPSPSPRAEILAVEALSVDPATGGRPLVDRVSFAVFAGEIVGLFGLSGAGASELLLGLSGALGSGRARAKEIRLSGVPVRMGSPREARALGVAFVPADRKTMGLVPGMTSEHNGTMVKLPALSPLGLLRPGRERRAALAMATDVGLRPEALAMDVATLSGGNQQKVVLGKWLLEGPRVLLCDEPTRGVDVGAKAEIHARIRALAASGAAVVVAGSDAREIAELADRVLVLRRGRIVAEIARPEASPAALLALAMGHDEAHA
ncbi:sugar ABC transporter ATP-binding protein [Polyangium spumosum]|nr:sugar ABC transporter ATP-binding protein [Polyangium spumosum]